MKRYKLITLHGKAEREQYPNLKTLSEISKMKRKLRNYKVRPRAIYIYSTPTFRVVKKLYDINNTIPIPLTKEEDERRREIIRAGHCRRRNLVEWRARRKELKEEIIPCQKVVFDIETTGLDPQKDEILQFSAINEKGEVLLNEYVKPVNHSEWPDAERINHISPTTVESCNTIEQLREKIQSVMYSATELIAYNGEFDMAFLIKGHIEIPDVPYTDVMRKFAPIYGEWSDLYETYKWKKLSECAAYYGYKFTAHDSLEDVRATLYCYDKIMLDS